jgi:hypothetical protein
MTRRILLTGLVNLVAVVICAAAAVAAVVFVNWAMGHAWPSAGPHRRLAFSMVAPFGVVLFGMLVEQAGRLTGATALEGQALGSINRGQ